MQSIELTQEHKDKLLEMCKILFPEYINVEIELEPDYEGLQYFIQLNKTDKIKEWIYIYWFEFVFIHLIEKLSEKLNIWEDIPAHVNNVYPNTKGKWNIYTKFHFFYPKACWGGCSNGKYKIPMNPIDYLYDEFKKLK